MARSCSRNEKGPCGPSPRSPCTGDPPPVSWITRSIARIAPEVKLAPGTSRQTRRHGENPAARAALQRKTCPDPGRIDAADRQIDQLVYQLYGLTDEEIRIVEEATG
jgi:hypothetical protein